MISNEYLKIRTEQIIEKLIIVAKELEYDKSEWWRDWSLDLIESWRNGTFTIRGEVPETNIKKLIGFKRLFRNKIKHMVIFCPYEVSRRNRAKEIYEEECAKGRKSNPYMQFFSFREPKIDYRKYKSYFTIPPVIK